MPRKPTGRPTGRPPGSGQLGLGLADDQERLSVRIPRGLYARFEAYAAGRSFHRGSPQLARYVREAMEEYLLRHTSRQTGSVPGAEVLILDRQEEEEQPLEDDVRQTENIPQPLEPTNARAALAERIRAMKATMSYAQIAARLNTEGVPTVSGSGKWAKGNIERLAKSGLQEG